MDEYVIRKNRAVVSLSEQEKEQLESMITLSGLSSQDFMRKVLLSGINGEHQIMVVEQSDDIKKLLKEISRTLYQHNQYIHQQNIEFVNLNYALSSNIGIIGETLRDLFKEYTESRMLVNNVRNTAEKIVKKVRQNPKYEHLKIFFRALLEKVKRKE